MTTLTNFAVKYCLLTEGVLPPFTSFSSTSSVYILFCYLFYRILHYPLLFFQTFKKYTSIFIYNLIYIPLRLKIQDLFCRKDERHTMYFN